MSTRVMLEIEIDLDVSSAALAAWVREALNFKPCMYPDISAALAAWVRESLNFEPCTDPDISAVLEALDGYEGSVRVTPFEPVFAELCETAAAIYPPATEEPEEEA